VNDSNPVLVVGGGIGGLAAALALAQKGYSIRVFEQALAFREIGAGIQLGPNVFKVLDRLGLRHAVDDRAVFPDRLILMDSLTSEQVACIPLGTSFVERFGYPYALIHRADLHTTLLTACRAHRSISLQTASPVDSFEETEEGVTATTGRGVRIRGAAIVGADGLWSKVRSQTVGDGPPLVSGHIAYRAVLPIEDVPERFRRQAMILWAGPRNHLVQYPLRGGKLFNLVAVFHSDRYIEGWNSQGDLAELRMRFEGTCEPVQTLLGKIQEWRMWVLCDREPVKHWSRGRMTLVGDAAHPMLQYLAQGAGMAIEDAVVLADHVEAAAGDFTAAFARYQEARYLRTGRCQVMARVYGEFYHASGVVRELRNRMLSRNSPDDWYDGMSWLYAGI
jgi:salicylate hydroxylase